MGASENPQKMRTDRTGKAVIDLATAGEGEVAAALARWDQLERRSLEALATHPVHGPRLRVLQLAEAWLDEQSPGGRSAAVRDCPSAAELYDHGRGIGHAPLVAERRAEVDRHLLRCADCRSLRSTTATRPPPPLHGARPAAPSGPPSDWRRELDEAGCKHGREVDRAFLSGLRRRLEGDRSRAETPPETTVPPAPPAPPARPTPLHPSLLRARRRRRTPERLLPLAAAASLLAAAFFLPHFSDAGHLSALPEAPLLRGATNTQLAFPRRRVLHVSAPNAWHGLPLGAEPLFECAPQPGAEGYDIEVFESGGTAFDAGRRVAHLADSQPHLAGIHSLAPGAYTWQAWAVVDGMRCELGERDFQVVPDRLLEAELEALAGLGEPARSVRAVRLLHEAGFLADARTFARRLPQGAERDAYLGRTPER
ncbi:MAG: hypothetical protein CMJ84_18450 [Planctomycetes bacterium]|jgi:hypothetical protein|nr:hypothetical protein [Planctomycetota bacterium]MDP6409539.1 hypothetical protein [Planctomycetota bacterium]